MFYTFTWKPRSRSPRPDQPRRAKGKPTKPKGRGKPEPKGARSFSAKPAKADKIDPDNPFAAALMGLKDKH